MTNEQFDQILENKETRIVIMSAVWCGPCKVLSKTVDKIKVGNPDLVDKITKIDIDEDQDLAQRFSVMSIPTILYVKNGEVSIKNGLQSESDLLSWFE
jgi:hypothetical protein